MIHTNLDTVRKLVYEAFLSPKIKNLKSIITSYLMFKRNIEIAKMYCIKRKYVDGMK